MSTTLGKGREVPGKGNTERAVKAAVAGITRRGIGTGKGTPENETGKGPVLKVIEVGRENVNESPQKDQKYIGQHGTEAVCQMTDCIHISCEWKYELNESIIIRTELD